MLYILIAFIIYVLILFSIGCLFSKQNKTISSFFIGDRKINYLVMAISTEVSDMSGWLLMGLPGAIYTYGINKIWVPIGLIAGTILNWFFVAKKFRSQTIKFGNAITIPEYLQNRFDCRNNFIKIISSILIVIFFTIYISSALVSSALLLSKIFSINYNIAVITSICIIFVYTFLGGFSAVCWADLFQGIIILCAVTIIPIIALLKIGGTKIFMQQLPIDFLNFNCTTKANLWNIISDLSWGLGYFGMPHILMKFTAIDLEENVIPSALIAIIWSVISISFAILIGLIGFVFIPNINNQEIIFISMIKKLFIYSGSSSVNLFFSGLSLCAILAAIISTASSQILVISSVITRDMLRPRSKIKNDKFFITLSRITMLIISIIAYYIAIIPNTSVMNLVSNAWAGLGSVFGPVILFSIYYKKTNYASAITGMFAGFFTCFAWDYLSIFGKHHNTLYQLTNVYSLLPGFIVSSLVIIILSTINYNYTRDV